MNLKKRLLILTMTFLLSFMVLTRKPYEPKAEVITLTTSTVYLLASVLSMMGLVVVNQDLIVDISSTLLEELKTIPNAIEELIEPKDPEMPEEPDNQETKIALHLLPEVKQKIKEVVDNLPVDAVTKPDPTAKPIEATVSEDFPTELRTTFQNKGDVAVYFTLPQTQYALDIAVFNDYGELFTLDTFRPWLKLSNMRGYKKGTDVAIQVTPDSNGFTISAYIDGSFVKSQTLNTDISLSQWESTEQIGFLIDASEDWEEFYYPDTITDKPSIKLPYSEEIKTDFDIGKIEVPDFSTIKVPDTIELPEISTETPFVPNLDKIEIVTPGEEVNPDNPSIPGDYPESPIDPDPDKIPGTDMPTDEEHSFWKILLDPILAILKAIWQVVVYIYNFTVEVIQFFLDQIVQVLYLILDGIVNIYMYLSQVLADLFNLEELLDGLKNLFNDFFKPMLDDLLDGLKQLGSDLFIPTIDFTTTFDFPDDLKQIPTIEMDRLFNINTKPIVYTFTFDMGNVQKEITLDFSKIDVLEDNLNLIRNLFSYCLLLGALYRIVNEIKPVRTMD